jgi:hypothetical protein
MTKPLQAIHALLFSNNDLKTAVNERIFYARGPISSQWPQVHYFDVAMSTTHVIDFDALTIQVSVWGLDQFQVLNISDLIYSTLIRYTGTVDIGGGETVDINFMQLIDRGALPEADQQLKGQFLRFVVRYRGQNIGD